MKCIECGAEIPSAVVACPNCLKAIPSAIPTATQPSAAPLVYAGFWRRLGSFFLDFTFLLPLIVGVVWLSNTFRLFQIYYLGPGILFGLFWSVYLVGRYGGTPGKLILGMRITKIDGTPATYRDAMIRYAPEFFLSLPVTIGFSLALLQVSDAEFAAQTFVERNKRLAELRPAFSKLFQTVQSCWIWSEFIVLLTNEKRRALHDFIAGTIVIRKPK